MGHDQVVEMLARSLHTEVFAVVSFVIIKNLAASNLILKRFLPPISAFYRLMSYITLETGERVFMCTGNVLETLEFKISFEQVCLELRVQLLRGDVSCRDQDRLFVRSEKYERFHHEMKQE